MFDSWRRQRRHRHLKSEAGPLFWLVTDSALTKTLRMQALLDLVRQILAVEKPTMQTVSLSQRIDALEKGLAAEVFVVVTPTPQHKR